MDCQNAQSVLLDPQDPSVDRSALLEAVSHALTCDACREFAGELRKIESILRLPGDEAIQQPRGGYEAFAMRLTPTAPATHRGPMRWVAAAAVVALVSGAYLLGTRQNPSTRETFTEITPGPRIAKPDPFAFTPAQVQQSSQAFAEVAEAFDQKATWVWTGDRAADVGVAQTPVDASKPVLLLKLILRSNGQVLSSGDLAIVSGQDASLSLPIANGKKVRYSISTRSNQPDHVGIAVELLEGNGSAKPLAALSTRVNAVVGQPVRAGEMTTTSGEYEVIASFARADAKGGL
jgi:hypothetical protein